MAKLTFRELERLSYKDGKEEALPLDNVREALALLSKDDSSLSTIGRPPEIRHSWGPTILSDSCLQELHAQGYIEGKPAWGHVSLYEFTLSRKGMAQLRQWEKEEEESARKLLIPGTHGWSSIWHYRGVYNVSRGDRIYENGLVFTNPVGESFIVFLERKAVESFNFNESSYQHSIPFTYLGHFVEGCDEYERVGFVFDIGNGKCRIYYPGSDFKQECSLDQVPTNLMR